MAMQQIARWYIQCYIPWIFRITPLEYPMTTISRYLWLYLVIKHYQTWLAGIFPTSMVFPTIKPPLSSGISHHFPIIFPSFSPCFPIVFPSIDVGISCQPSGIQNIHSTHRPISRFLVRKEQSWRKAELEVKEMSVQLEVLSLRRPVGWIFRIFRIAENFLEESSGKKSEIWDIYIYT